jgi:hypothetical protein
MLIMLVPPRLRICTCVNACTFESDTDVRLRGSVQRLERRVAALHPKLWTAIWDEVPFLQISKLFNSKNYCGSG